MKMHDPSYSLDNISISANNKGKEGHLDVEAPFVNLYARGQYDLTTIYGSIMRLVADKLPTIPGISKHAAKGNNDFTLQANITSAEVLQRMFGLPLSLSLPVHINGNISDAEKNVNLYINAPNFSWDGSAFHDASIELNTIGDSLRMEARICQGLPYEKAQSTGFVQRQPTTTCPPCSITPTSRASCPSRERLTPGHSSSLPTMELRVPTWR